ncbi:MAG TPA: O-antigen ligase family protein [Clostridia bacterium]|nr:O-antigen ligase family protein [Clostridia bacterium]
MLLFYLLILLMAVVRHPWLSPLLGEDTMFKYLGAVCAVYAGIYVFRRRTVPPIFRTWQMRIFLVLYACALDSYFTLGLTHYPALSYSSMAVLLLVTMTIVDTESRLRGTLIAVVASLAFASLYVIREWQVYHTMYEGMRAAGITGDSNYFSASALVSIAVAYYLTSRQESKFVRLFAFGSLIIIMVAIMLAASRGGLIGLAVAAALIAVRSRHRILASIAMPLFLAAFLFLAPNSPLDRFLHPGYGDDLAVQARKLAWTAGMRMIDTHPLFGVGLGNFKPMMSQYSDPGVTITEIAHNTYIEIAAELGIPALLLFLALVAATFLSLQKARRQALELEMDLVYRAAGAMQAGLLGFAVAAVVLSAEYQKLFWLVLGISMALPQIIDARLRMVAENQGELPAQDAVGTGVLR